MTTDMNGLDAWDRRTRELLEEAYVAAGDNPRGARSQRVGQRLVRRLDVRRSRTQGQDPYRATRSKHSDYGVARRLTAGFDQGQSAT
jgi:hypothetical protein